MLSQVCENFFQGIEDDVPEVKLMKYRFFLSIDKNNAETIMPKMLKIALDHELIGQYEMIHQITKQAIGGDEKYKKLRETMSSTTIKLINQSSNLQQVNNTQNLGPCYKNIADTYFKFAQYKEAFSYYRKLFRLADKTVKDQQFFTKMALATYYLDDYGELSMYMKAQLQKNSKRNMIDYCIIHGLKSIEVNPQNDNIFENVIQLDISIQQLMQNKVISFSDMGFLYSLLLIAYQSREKMCQDIKWSFKLQNIYLRKNYKKLLDTISLEKKKRCYNSLFYKIYNKCEEEIRQRVLLEVVACYERCPYEVLKKVTGITEGQVLVIIKNNHYIPLLNDPVSQSFVYQRKSFELHRQVMKLHSYLGNKYEEEVKRALRLMEDEDMELGGGMGGMGGLGKRRMGGGGLGMGGGRRHM